MFLEIFRHALYANRKHLLQHFDSLEKKISKNMNSQEKNINHAIFQHFSPYRTDLGTVAFKNRQYKLSIESEPSVSHGKKCQVPMLLKPTELGDLILLVDHILQDERGEKIVSGTASIIQTKKESFVKSKGINLRQLLLMTYWPEFSYKNRKWRFDIVADQFSFYLLVNDIVQARSEYCTNVLSSPCLTRLLNLDESYLQNQLMSGKDFLKLKTTSMFSREKIGDSNARQMPFLIRTFFIKALYPTLGSQSLTVRHFLRLNFFSKLGEIEDCELQSVTDNRAASTNFASTKSDKPPFDYFPKDDEDDIFAIRLKMISKRIE